MFCVWAVSPAWHVFVVQDDGWTPLHVASKNGHVDAVRALLDAGAAVNQAEVSGYCRTEEQGMAMCVCGMSVGGGGV